MFWIVIAVLVWLGFAVGANWVLDNPRGDLSGGVAFRFVRVYARVVHRLEVVGLEHVPKARRAGPLIVIANHTAGVDPLLIQAVCPFEVRWMMMRTMMIPAADWFWEWAGIIAVGGGKDSLSAREAIAHVKDGGVLGIFPEGGIERPPGMLKPFQPGLGLIVARSGAKVLPVVITGTPQVDPAFASLWRMSRSRVEFKPVMDLGGMKAGAIAGMLQTKYEEWTGWKTGEAAGVG